MEYRIGDVVKPIDGSSMPAGFHKLLWNGKEVGPPYPLPSEIAFKPVKVLAIEGNLLGVAPLDWKEWGNWIEDVEIKGGKSSLYTGNKERFGNKRAGEGFWIHKAHVMPIKKEPGYLDITNECRTELRKSGHSEGYYSAIMHNSTLVAALGYGRLTPINIKKGYKIEKAKGAVISFRVYKKS